MFSRIISLCIVCIAVSISAIAQIKINPVTPKDIPVSAKYEGKIVQAVTWQDKDGKHYIILTETGEFYSTKLFGDGIGSEEDPSVSLFAYHYIQSIDSSRMLWRVTDYIHNCPVDYAAKFCKGSLTVTDLDSNCIPEVTFMYKTGCAGDVSPLTLKLIMYEGKNKYALRGNTQVFDTPKNSPSSYKIDLSFKQAPPIFLNYAEKHWKNFDEYSYD